MTPGLPSPENGARGTRIRYIPPSMSPGLTRTILIGTFFATGAGALAYEVAWMRMLSLVFGVSVYAVSAVLTAFMGGLALGSRLFGGISSRMGASGGGSARLLRLYAAVQAGIGLFALASPWLFSRMTGLYTWFHRALDPGFHAYSLIRFVLAALVLLLPTTLMGATLPILSQVLARDETKRGGRLGALYAANTFGGVAGILAVAFFALRSLGVRGTIGAVAALDLAVALGVGGLSLLTDGASRAPASGGVEEGAGRQPTSLERRALWAFAASGFAALGYEVLWFRVITLVTLNAVYSFSIMLATFLVGIAAGSAAASLWIDRAGRAGAVLGMLQVCIAASTSLVLFLLPRLAVVVGHAVSPDTIPEQIAAEFFGSGVVMLVPTLLMGASFPVAARIYGGGTSAVGLRVGRLYALNTVGSMAGAFVAGFVMIPLLGLQRSSLALALLNLAAGGAVLLAVPARAGRRVAAGLALAVAAAFLLPPGAYLGAQYAWSPRLIFYSEGVGATVAVFERPTDPPMKISYVNGRSEVPTDPYSMRAFHLLGHLPPLLKPDARSALMISFGNGIASGCMSRHGIPRIHAVELVAGQVEAARHYTRENRGVLDYPGLTITVEDGRNFLLVNDETWDIITADATHPLNASSWALFTREFYTLVKEHLTPDGVFLQWLPFHTMGAADYRNITGTFRDVFPHATLWFTSGTHTFLLATPGRLTRHQVADLEARIDSLGIDDDLADLRPLLRTLLLTETDLEGFTAGWEEVTDDNAFFMPSVEGVDRITRGLAAHSSLRREGL